VADGSSEPRPLVLVAHGCRVSLADADALWHELGPSVRLVRPGEVADVVVVNGCAVTADAESAARQAIRRAGREHPGARIVAAGCCAEVSPAVLGGLPGVVAVVGARSQGAVIGVVRRLLGSEDAPAPIPPGASAPARHARFLLKVQDGCDERCSYCVVPAARGPSRSLPLDAALGRLARLGERHPEVILTGVHLGAYGRDLAPPRSLEALVRAAARRGLVGRLRLSSVEPHELPLPLLRDRDVMARLCAHFHLPVQSGSERILRAMGRRGGAERLRRAVDAVGEVTPEACLGTDLLVGFPGETDADHAATTALVEALPLAYLHVFPFSPRPGTPAATLAGQVPAAVSRARARELRAVSDRKWRAFLAARIGRVVEVVVERVEGGLARGTARDYAAVRFAHAGARRGEVARVRVAGSDASECFGVREGAQVSP
jgi:threonylcarbamoyladenosine tRNA methylthiotransferase MtaB